MRLALIAVGLAAACSSNPALKALPDMSSAPDLAISGDTACADFVHAYCTQLETCGPPAIKVAFGDEATCEMRLNLTCARTFQDPGTTLTPSQLDSCAAMVLTLTCAQLLDRNLPTVCTAPAGMLIDGTVCGDSGQCQHQACKHPAGSMCGVCGTVALAGQACVADDDCDYGLVCAASACVKRGAASATCDAGHPCQYGLSCNGGTCQTAPGAGMACTTSLSGGNCDQTKGLFCGLNGLCQSAQYSSANQVCGFSSGNYYLCTAASKCTASGLSAGTCTPAAADGAACNATNGPLCMAPAACINSVCTLPNPSTCK